MSKTIRTQVLRNENRQADSQLRRNWAKLRRNKAALFGGILILIYLITALLAPVLFPGSPSAPNLIRSLERPSIKHPLGTDELGRSILGRIIYGSRVSFLIAIGVVAVGLAVGVPLGLVSGYYGGEGGGYSRYEHPAQAYPTKCRGPHHHSDKSGHGHGHPLRCRSGFSWHRRSATHTRVGCDARLRPGIPL